ncbi:hypothetical protein GCM10009836_21600 [Pseudonocardia ailaonensis]|uniref:Pyridoxamine 5-phosphate oxidase n=2 Tax=Pseudonocardia ailaonensis TaxID=367279 RepID=A0ABN2MX75_9PSEU
MAGARKLADLRRDPRFALHSGSDDPPETPNASTWAGDAKVSGRAVPTGSPGDDGSEGFRVDVTEVVVTGLNEAGDRLVVEFWREGAGLRRVERT